MTVTVSFTDFRDNLSDYARQARQGMTVIVKDNKRDEELIRVTGGRNWNPQAYKAMLKRMLANPISAKDHPEWATRRSVEAWLRKSRIADERKFDVHP